MQIRNEEYEQLAEGRSYFRYGGLRFEESGIRYGNILIEYPENIKHNPKSISLIKFVLASRVITDTYTLEQFLKRASIKLTQQKKLLSALPLDVSNQFFGIFLGHLIETSLGKVLGTRMIDVETFEIEEIEMVVRLMDYRIKFTKLVEAEIRRHEGFQVPEVIRVVKEKAWGHFAAEFPEIGRNPLILGLIKKEVGNAIDQLSKIVSSGSHLQLRDYDDEVKVLLRPRVGHSLYDREYHSERFSRVIGKVTLIKEGEIPEIYTHINVCPFPDIVGPLGETYEQKCPFNHEQ